MAIKDKMLRDMKEAMKAKDILSRSTLRMLLSEIKYAQSAVNMKVDLDDDAVEKVIATYHKRLQKSLADYPDGDQKEKIKKEIKIVENYLPKQLTAKEIEKVVDMILKTQTKKDFGPLMKECLAQLKGAADGKVVSTILKDKLKKIS